MAGPTAKRAHLYPTDASLRRGIAYLSAHAPRLTPAETQEAAVAYDRARMALWEHAVDRCLGGWRWPGLRAWVRSNDLGLRRSALIADGADELALLAEARRQRERAAWGCLGLAEAFARQHRGAGTGSGRGMVLVAEGGDALQSALEQVLHALDRYDPEHRSRSGRTCKASSFAAWYARKGVQDARMASAGLRTSAVAHWGRAEAAERDLRRELGREPTWDEVVGRIGQRPAAAAARVARTFRVVGAPPAAPGLDAPERPSAEPLPDELLGADDLRREVDDALPPGSTGRRVVEALIERGWAAAREVAGSRRAAEEEVAAARERVADDDDPSPVRVPRSPWKPIRPERVVVQVAPPAERPPEDAPHLAGVLML